MFSFMLAVHSGVKMTGLGACDCVRIVVVGGNSSKNFFQEGDIDRNNARKMMEGLLQNCCLASLLGELLVYGLLIFGIKMKDYFVREGNSSSCASCGFIYIGHEVFKWRILLMYEMIDDGGVLHSVSQAMLLHFKIGIDFCCSKDFEIRLLLVQSKNVFEGEMVSLIKSEGPVKSKCSETELLRYSIPLFVKGLAEHVFDIVSASDGHSRPCFKVDAVLWV